MRSRIVSRRHPSLKKSRLARARLKVESLEDRTLMSSGQWVAVFSGVTPAANLAAQTTSGVTLLHAYGIEDDEVRVLNALDLYGTFLVQAPSGVGEETLTSELHEVPGFRFVREPWSYEVPPDDEGEGEGEGERPGSDL